MLHKQFEVLGYKEVNCIKGTLGLASIVVKRRENSQNPSYAFTTLIIIKMNDLGNSRCLAGSGAFPNSSCNKEPPCTVLVLTSVHKNTPAITIYISIHKIILAN